jgi:hypothetical protein
MIMLPASVEEGARCGGYERRLNPSRPFLTEEGSPRFF